MPHPRSADYPATQKLRQKRHYDYNRAVATMFKNRPCEDCHVQYPSYVMQFDHKEKSTKKFNIGSAINTRPLRDLLDEIAKCDVVCANCHMARTYGPKR